MAQFIRDKAISTINNLKPCLAVLAAFGLLFAIQSHSMAKSSRAYEIAENGFRTRQDLMREYMELSEIRCAKGLFASGITGRECLLILRSRNIKCQEQMLSLMPEKIWQRADAILWAKAHARCLDM